MSAERHDDESYDDELRETVVRLLRDRRGRGMMRALLLEVMAEEFLPAIRSLVRTELKAMRDEIAVGRLRTTVDKINRDQQMVDAVREELVACLAVYGIALPVGVGG